MRRNPRSNFDAALREIVARHVDNLTTDIATAVRRNLGQELRAYLNGDSRVSAVKKRGNRRRSRDMRCIAPECANRSKGPRFHYLCDTHVNTPKKVYDKWREDADHKA